MKCMSKGFIRKSKDCTCRSKAYIRRSKTFICYFWCGGVVFAVLCSWFLCVMTFVWRMALPVWALAVLLYVACCFLRCAIAGFQNSRTFV